MGEATQQWQRVGRSPCRAAGGIWKSWRTCCCLSPVQTSFKIYARRLGQWWG
uniref:Alternative protein TNRC6C n=1 Tax=Homo sapiens TaxID=9606 RepID=L8EB01_HUMAN|nr:alternative protein TNRC6C [Homo sapiens]